MKYCKDCGSEIPDDALFCPSCGRNVQNDGQQQNNAGNTYSQYGNNYTRTPVYPADKYSILSTLGFVFSFLEPLVGLILSIIAYNQAKTECSPKSQNFAKAGIIVSSVFLGIAVFTVVLVCILVGVGVIAGINYWAAALALM